VAAVLIVQGGRGGGDHHVAALAGDGVHGAEEAVRCGGGWLNLDQVALVQASYLGWWLLEDEGAVGPQVPQRGDRGAAEHDRRDVHSRVRGDRSRGRARRAGTGSAGCRDGEGVGDAAGEAGHRRGALRGRAGALVGGDGLAAGGRGQRVPGDGAGSAAGRRGPLERDRARRGGGGGEVRWRGR